MRDPIRSHRFRLLLTSRVLSQLGDAAVPAALALGVLQATGSLSALALVLACSAGSRSLLLPVGGVIADRLGARRVAIGADVIRCAVQAFVGIQLLSGVPQLWMIAAAQILSGAATAFAVPTRSPLVAGVVPRDGLQKANAHLGTGYGLAQLAGPAAAGAFVFTVGPGWTFILDAATFAVSAVVLSAIPVAAVRVPRSSFRSDLVEGWEHVRSRDWFWTSILAHGLANGAAMALVVLGPAIAVAELGGEGAWVLTLQVGAIGLMLGSMAAARLRTRRPILVGNLALVVFALPLVLFGLGAPLWAAAGAFGLSMIGLGLHQVQWETAVQKAMPAHALARVTSYDWLVSSVVTPLGFLAAPLAAAAWGWSWTLIAAAVIVATACLATAAVPGVRRPDGATDAAPAVDTGKAQGAPALTRRGNGRPLPQGRSRDLSGGVNGRSAP